MRRTEMEDASERELWEGYEQWLDEQADLNDYQNQWM